MEEKKCRMIQTKIQNDTILKQLDKSVELNSVATVNIQRKLIEPANIRKIDSINRQDTLSENILPPKLKDQRSNVVTTSVQKTNRSSNDSIVRLESKTPELMFTEIAKSEIILPEKKLDRNRPDWAVGIFILAFIIFATVRLFFNKFLNQLISASVNYSTATRLFRERSLNIRHGAFRLEVLFYIILSYFIFQAGAEYGYSFNDSSWISYLQILAAVVFYFLGKRVLYSIIGFFTESVSSTQEYLFNLNQYNRILGLLLLPISLIINFTPLANPRILFVMGLILIVIITILSLLRGARILLMQHLSIYYLILYLCTLEILPLVYILKLVLE